MTDQNEAAQAATHNTLDSLFQAMAGSGLVARTVAMGGQSATVHFKRITAAQRVALLKGQRFETTGTKGDKPRMQFDLGEARERDQKLVLYAVARADGSAYFRDLADVQARPAAAIEALAKVAGEVNKDDEEDLGKS